VTETRHEWIDDLCTRLELILLGRAADQLLSAPLPERAAVVVAPVWTWLPPRINMGRKTRRTDGATMLMPVRMTWQPSPLILVTEPVDASWSMVGLGHSGAGQVRLIPNPGAIDVTGEDFPTDGELGVPPLTATGIRTRLTSLSDAGRKARWDALMSLEWYVERAVHRAVATVSWDIGGSGAGGTPTWVLDETASQTVRDQMLLGTEQSPGRVHHLIERCLEPSAFTKVDPLRYVVIDLHRSAEQEVRKYIGDPHIGRKIRAVHRTMPSASLQEIIATYRRAHPGDHLSVVRARHALTAGPDAMASFTDLSDADTAVPSCEDSVVARLDLTRAAG
jgi:hypothetical protein